MKIDIERLGLKNVNVDPETLLTFPKGLAGFEVCKRFKLFHEEGKPTVFWLQSVDDEDIMFPVVTPEQLDLQYEIELSDEDCALIDLKDPSQAVVAVIVYRDDAQGGRIDANARSPIILNLASRKGMQKILSEVRPAVVMRGR
ncbi:flagellar assembly protein FliW [Propionivibrio soli]|jgi:flagellar assembly factor FliW|uniref:flagellar assembly protein FliW n=1 Tax=Propionivibrio soli TaxID=2976531 RepID=UPI0021E85AED|nr:flagellar assembly protein FliW [Propionivibrio soli]